MTKKNSGAIIFPLLTIIFLLVMWMNGVSYIKEGIREEERSQIIAQYKHEYTQKYYFCNTGKPIEKEEHYDLLTNYSLSCEDIQEILIFGTQEQRRRTVIFYKPFPTCEEFGLDMVSTTNYKQEDYERYYDMKCKGELN